MPAELCCLLSAKGQVRESQKRKTYAQSRSVPVVQEPKAPPHSRPLSLEAGDGIQVPHLRYFHP